MDSQRQHLLVVEDDSAVADLLRIFFESERYRVSVAESGGRALDLVKKEGVDLVLLDQSLPDVGASRFLEALRSEPRAAELPVIVVSGYPLSPGELSVAAVVSKPPDVTQLLLLVRHELARAAGADRRV